MSTLLTLLSSPAYINFPQTLIGWISVFALLGLVGFLLWRWREYNKDLGRESWTWLIILLIATPIASLFLGIRLPAEEALPLPGVPANPEGAAAMIFSAAPWMLAGGLLGPLPAALLALFAGILRAIWDTHNIFTPLEMMLLAILFSAIVRQRYRTRFYRLISRPVAAAFLLALVYPLLHLSTTVLAIQGPLVIRLDYAITNLPNIWLTIGVELLAGGLFAEILAITMPARWGSDEPLIPSPAEQSLQARFIYSMAPLAMILVLTLMVGDWLVAGNAARDMLEERMSNSAWLAAQNVPYVLETGQQLIQQISGDARLLSADGQALTIILQEKRRTVPFFHQLFILDVNENVLASDPDNSQAGQQASLDEQMGFQLALSGVPYQHFTTQPAQGQDTAQISFMATLTGAGGKVERILVGRTTLGENPMMKPILTSLNSLSADNGQGMLIDENNIILVHSDPAQVMGEYDGPHAESAMFFDTTAPDGTRQMVYYQPALGHPWVIVLTVPALLVQQMALDIAMPLLLMIVALSLLSIVVLRFGLSVVTSSLQTLAQQAGRIAQGRLDHPLAVDGADEVGRLRRAFERMRVSLKARLDELNRLLIVSQGVASSLEMSEAAQPVLESALATGASSARVVLTPTVIPELNGASNLPISFGAGPAHNLYAGLDDQILAYTRQQERLVLSNLLRPRLLNIPLGSPRPESLFAVALRHENLYYGALWVAYDQPHNFTEEEVRFLITLGGHAALAAANAGLFQKAEIGRQRLAAILASSPDPILVTDQRDRLLLANPAAWQALGLGMDVSDGKPIDEIITQNDLLELLRTSSDEKQTTEIILPDNRIYLAGTTPVLAEGQRVGRVCILQDVTYFKELDSLKSEFVSTVSHDLRSPLTLMRGYATMLEMVGQLNEQQLNYVRKIVTGVESMSRLVNNLLDLGRIEAGIGLQLEMIPVQDVVERVVGTLQLQAAQKNIQMTTEIPAQTIPLIEGDQALLQQAMHNLVENAVKYTQPNGKIHVRVRVEPTGMIFEVQDSGIGISPMDQQHLFEKFYRGAQQGAKAQRGTGLGLAIVKSIAERHGGQVWAESQLGKGSTFGLSIPLRQPQRQLQR